MFGIIDGLTDSCVEDLPTSAGAHSVSVDPITNEGFVPFGGVAGNAVCSDGCVAVFAETALRPEPGSLLLLLSGVACSCQASPAPVRRRLLLSGVACSCQASPH